MTEEKIELLVARRVDALDRAYLSSNMSDEDYKRQIDAIDSDANRLRQTKGTRK